MNKTCRAFPAERTKTMNFYDFTLRPPTELLFKDDKGIDFTVSDFKKLNDMIRAGIPKRSLVFLFARNERIPVGMYLSLLQNKIVPLLLSPALHPDLLRSLLQIYQPDFILGKESLLPVELNYSVIQRIEDYIVLRTGFRYPHRLHEDLALLLTTSGSTGSPKLVRQSYRNIESNAAAIADYLNLSSAERPITTLPMHYTYGLSVINSHLQVGAPVLLTEKSIVEKEFWDFLRQEKATSIAGVPYTYTMLDRLRFFNMDLPDLKMMTQAGGKLSEELQRKFTEYAAQTGRKFVVMYGQTEATARMAYLPPEKALAKIGCMGIAIPGGRFELIDEEETVIEQPETAGELIYYGPNVTLGYAEQAEDLSRGDERKGRLATGDMAVRDTDGFYRIVGRKKRFLKIFGNRVNLDEIEAKCAAKFVGHEFACIGRDDEMTICHTGELPAEKIQGFLQELTGLYKGAFVCRPINEIPKNEAGKILYAKL